MGTQVDMFNDDPTTLYDGAWFEPEPEPIAEMTGARYYQRECVQHFMSTVHTSPWQLIVLATGLGKTYIASLIARLWNEGDILALAHRDELIEQLRASFERMTGELVEVEQAELRSSSQARIVVGSVQSMNEARLRRLGKERFGLIITDEAHHATAPIYGRCYDWFTAKYGLGMTATPDRADEKSLGRIFGGEPYIFDLRQGIEAGFLVPIEDIPNISIKEIDISGVAVGQGEGGLNMKELDDAMLKAVEGIVVKSFEHGAQERHGIWFWPGVRTAQYAAERVNVLRPGTSAFISGETPPEERERIVEDFRRGRVQHLHNCAIATEGFDAPICDLIVHGRPTKSRALHAQMVGRGTRVLPGVVDDFTERDQQDDRHAAIAWSAKPSLRCLDFMGNWGRHEIVTTLDVLGGSYTEAEVKHAKKKAAAAPGQAINGLAALEAARAELRAMANATRVNKVSATVQWIQPFATLGLRANPQAEEAALRFGEAPVTDAQFELLVKRGLTKEEAGALSKVTASRMLNEMSRRIDLGLASLKQLRQLERFGLPNDPKITFERATAGLNYVKAKGWNPQAVDPLKLHDIVYHKQKDLPL